MPGRIVLPAAAAGRDAPLGSRSRFFPRRAAAVKAVPGAARYGWIAGRRGGSRYRVLGGYTRLPVLGGPRAPGRTNGDRIVPFPAHFVGRRHAARHARGAL